MRQFIQVLAILFLSSFLFSQASASPQPYFGTKNVVANYKTDHFTRVMLYNYTYDQYSVRSIYQPTGSTYDMYLGPVDSATGSIVYDITFPDYAVCLSVMRNYDGLIVYQGCSSSDNIYITNMFKSNKPIVKLAK